MDRSLLVLGADYGGLGRTIYDVANKTPDTTQDGYCYDYVEAAGLSPDGESTLVDVRSLTSLASDVPWVRFEDVVFCAGLNLPTDWRVTPGYFSGNLVDHMNVNFIGAMVAAKLWMDTRMRRVREGVNAGSFVVLSSNSALIPRSGSAGYCASKAAVSMGIKCLARDMSKDIIPGSLYGYEPCWLENTNMSAAVKERLPEGVPLHRVPRGYGQDPGRFADLIVSNLLSDSAPDILHGSMLRVDLGDT